jgi:hypothetical protein
MTSYATIRVRLNDLAATAQLAADTLGAPDLPEGILWDVLRALDMVAGWLDEVLDRLGVGALRSAPKQTRRPRLPMQPARLLPGYPGQKHHGWLEARAANGDHAGTEPEACSRNLVPTAWTGPASQRELLREVLAEQFDVLRQELFDHFHRPVQAITQLLGALRREQLHLLRQELEQVQALTRELQDLQAALRMRSAAAPLPPAAEAAPPAAAQPAGRNAAERPALSAAPVADPRWHYWLQQRMAALTAQRKGRWEKVLDLLMGR